MVARLGCQPGSGLARDRPVNPADLVVLHGRHGRVAAVSLLSNTNVQRQGAEQIHAMLFGHPLTAARTENMFDVATLAADMDAHVFDDPEYRHLDLFEHLQSLACIQQCNVLRRGHDDRTADRNALRQR